MRKEFDPESTRFTSDRIGFEGFRVLVRELSDQGEAGTGKAGLPIFRFTCRPIREKGHTLLTFQEDPDHPLAMNRISTIMPPHTPFVLNWRRAAGRLGTFEVHPRFFEQTLRRAGLAAARFQAVPRARFIINRRVDWLCQLLMEETERGGPSGRAYFEHLAAALLLAVASQSDPRLPDAGDAGAQLRRVQQAVALMEANFGSKLTLAQLAAAAGLSVFHFSRLFHRVMGTSPHQYLLGCRLRHAHGLLVADSGRSLAEVAAECGFADQTRFGRHFRRAYGVSPGQVRGAQE